VVAQFKRTHHKPPSQHLLWFHTVVRNGEGEMELSSLRWTTNSCKNRFRLFIQTLRHTPTHELHTAAMTRVWKVKFDGGRMRVDSTPMSEREHELLYQRMFRPL
jgi:hypothetical protein